jgi:leucyl aminopeptidase
MFLKGFVDETPCIHTDIADVAWMDENKSWMAKGAVRIAVRSLVEFGVC